MVERCESWKVGRWFVREREGEGEGGLVRRWEGLKVRRFCERDPPSLLVRCAEEPMVEDRS